MNINGQITKELNLRKEQTAAVIVMLSEGSTIPFIARYRKESTGGLDEDVLREIEEKFNYYTMLEERKETILKSIEEQGKLTEELRAKIVACVRLQELEDLYLPYKPKRRTKGSIARAKGLEPLSLFILENPKFKGDFNEKLLEFVNPELGVNSPEEALQGAKDILAEMASDSAEVRKAIREFLLSEGVICSEKAKALTAEKLVNLKMKEKNDKEVYKVYFEFKVAIGLIKPYQTLALNRGEKESFLNIKILYDEATAVGKIKSAFLNYSDSVFMDILSAVVVDSLNRLIFPSLEREVRNYLTETADFHAIDIFARNLRALLLQPPISGKIIMGLDPGFYSGCKIAIIDPTGKYLEGATIYPHEPKSQIESAERIVVTLIKKYGVEVIAIGNGTASRETEMFIAAVVKKHNFESKYTLVNEAGASVYSASEIAKREFPDLEASQRGNISIARRLLDPLAELVKIDPKSIGVGLYQHDVEQKMLTKKLEDVVVSCVNYVGVDLNTASVPLLTQVSGLTRRLAESIIRVREEKGAFKSREELKEVRGIGEKVFEQCAGFLKIPGGINPFDNTFIHPESYKAAESFLKIFKITADKLYESVAILEMLMKQKNISKLAADIGVGEPTLNDIFENIKKPGRDPREELPKPILRGDVLKMEDLQIGMKLKGTVRNVVDFGAFVDIGVKQDALLHISQIGNKFVKNPLEELSVGDIIDATILTIDVERKRVALTMKT